MQNTPAFGRYLSIFHTVLTVHTARVGRAVNHAPLRTKIAFLSAICLARTTKNTAHTSLPSTISHTFHQHANPSSAHIYLIPTHPRLPPRRTSALPVPPSPASCPPTMLAPPRPGLRELPRGAVMRFTSVDGVVRAAPRPAHNTAGIAARIRGGVLEEFSFSGRAHADDNGIGAAQGEARSQMRAHARAQAWCGAKGGRAKERKDASKSFWRRKGRGGDCEWPSERRGWAWRGGMPRRGASFARTPPEKRGARAAAQTESGRFAALGRRFRAAAPPSQSSEAGTASSGEADDENLWGG